MTTHNVDLHSSVSANASARVGDEVDSVSVQRTVNNDSNVMRHQYRVLDDTEKAQMILVKDLGLRFWQTIDGIGQSRELALAKTRIEEAVMWAVKHITK
jgi:hypothetical protein